MNIATIIRKEVEKSGRTQTSLCKITGIKEVRMSLFMTGQGGMWPTDLIKLLLALNFKIIDPSGNELKIDQQ